MKVYIFILGYIFFLVFFYIIVIKRMKYLSKRHVQNTGIDSLGKGYRKVQKKLILICFILAFLVSLLFLIFIKNDLLGERLIHINKKTLDNNGI
ncbi:hypothetical protein DLH72_01800 [Candidatus Gracilibacteria bacterium]|nr:MAG: hypothetical protein DLH72_01800 [Candidatus Gracilibacteria bacterium]